MGAWIDITGKTFGCWKVIEYVGSSTWKCVCTSCSTIHCINGYSLRGQKYGMCINCWHQTKQTHGHAGRGTRSKAYTAWQAMIQRCGNPNNPGYHRYGGRGIRVCEAWQQFENFFRDMGDSPLGLSIGRINNNRNYEPSNCRWETDTEQQNNREVCRLVKFQGLQMTCAEFSHLVGIDKSSIFKVFRRAKWPRDLIPTIIQVPYGTKKRFALC